MIGISATHKTSGPLFTGIPENILNKHVRNAVEELIEKGEEMLATTLSPRPKGVYLSKSEAQPGKHSTGNYRRNLESKVSGISGVIHDNGVVYGPWLEGTSSRNQTTRFKGYTSFRKTRDKMDGMAQGLLETHIKKAVSELN